MGAFGYGIFENDDACDVKNKVSKYMKTGMSAYDSIIKCMKDYSLFMDDMNVVLAIAAIEMEHRCLEPHIKTSCLLMIAEPRNMKKWMDPGRRLQVLEEFKQKLLKY